MMMKEVVYLGLMLLVLEEDIQATLTSIPTVACPNEDVAFTCIQSGTFIIWAVNLGTMVGDTLDLRQGGGGVFMGRTNVNPNFVFEGVLTVSGGNATSTLTTITDDSLLEGTVVTCEGQSGLEGPLTISLADPPSLPFNPRVTSSLDGPSSSNVTLQWDHSTLDLGGTGVSVQYILSISPTPLSGSAVTMETTSVVITMEYNRQYNVTIRAENCAGISFGSTTKIEIVACLWPLTPAAGVVITSSPTVPVVNSTLTFTCNSQSSSIPSTCTSEGLWSPDPQTYDKCPTEAPVTMCDHPSPPANGSIVDPPNGPLPEDMTIYYRCKDSFFPTGDQPLTCGSDGMREPNTQDQLCSPDPFNCTVPDSPTNGFVVQTSNTTIVFGCNEGFSPQQNMTANCVAVDQWSPPIPEEIICVFIITPTVPTAPSLGPIVGGVVGGLLFLIVQIVIIIIVLLVVSSKRAKYTVPAGPVYDEVSPAPNKQIELNTNSAYGSVTPGPVYEDVLSAPKQEIELKANDAYGQVGR